MTVRPLGPNSHDFLLKRCAQRSGHGCDPISATGGNHAPSGELAPVLRTYRDQRGLSEILVLFLAQRVSGFFHPQIRNH